MMGISRKIFGAGFLGLLICLVSSLDLADAQSCSPDCQNGGICSFQLSTGTYSCNCAGTGYTGDSCATLAGAPSNSSTSEAPANNSAGIPTSGLTCNGLPCYRGVCQQEQDTRQLFCQCISGYRGTYCNQTVAPAPAPSLAVNNQSCPTTCYNGVCQRQFNSPLYLCQCNAGYTGQSCNVRSAPAPSPAVSNQTCPIACYNGVCQQQYNSPLYTCQCLAGYTGNSCNQAKAASPSGPNAGCASGCFNGQCIAFANGTSHCQCNDGFTGSTCSQRAISSGATENNSSGGGSHISGGAIFAIVLIVMLAVIALAIGGFLLWRRRRRQTFVRFQDGQDGVANVEIGKQKMSSDSFGLRSSSSALMS